MNSIIIYIGLYILYIHPLFKMSMALPDHIVEPTKIYMFKAAIQRRYLVGRLQVGNNCLPLAQDGLTGEISQITGEILHVVVWQP